MKWIIGVSKTPRTEEHRAKRRRYMKRYRGAILAEGRCPECGHKRYANKYACDDCRAHRREVGR